MSKRITVRNNGRRWRHSLTGEVVATGGLFIATEEMVDRMQKRGQISRNRFEIVSDEEAWDEVLAEVEDEAEDDEAEVEAEEEVEEEAEEDEDGWEDEDDGEDADEEEEWPLKMTPGTYVGLHPEGQHADLARRLLEQEEE